MPSFSSPLDTPFLPETSPAPHSVVPANTPTWEHCLEKLKDKMSLPSFETWIAPLKLSAVEEGAIVLLADTPFNRDWVLKHYRVLIEQVFAEIFESTPRLEIQLQTAPKADEGFDLVDDHSILEPAIIKPYAPPWTPRTSQSNLNPKYTFEHFVIGQHNRFCHAAALAVAETPAQSYNPFFIYGGVGLGKTHLMQAIGHFALKHHSDLSVRYVTAEQFTNDLISSLGRKDMKSFRDRFRKSDILIIDDVQFLEGKERTQEEVFHTPQHHPDKHRQEDDGPAIAAGKLLKLGQ